MKKIAVIAISVLIALVALGFNRLRAHEIRMGHYEVIPSSQIPESFSCKAVIQNGSAILAKRVWTGQIVALPRNSDNNDYTVGTKFDFRYGQMHKL